MSGGANPRYAIWRAHTGETLNHEFMIWIGQRWIEWCAINGRNRDNAKSRQDHEDFDAWLSQNHTEAPQA